MPTAPVPRMAKLVIAVSFPFTPMLNAQAQATDGLIRDGAFLEAAGHSIYWSLNYERTRYWNPHWATHGRIGFGKYEDKNIDLVVVVPLTFSGS